MVGSFPVICELAITVGILAIQVLLSKVATTEIFLSIYLTFSIGRGLHYHFFY